MEQPQETILLTAKELAEAIKVHTNTIYQWGLEGMPCLLIGVKRKRYELGAVRTWLEGRTEKQQPEAREEVR
jgi:phage terminase Nu1 subunit (DNA packaging protein)